MNPQAVPLIQEVQKIASERVAIEDYQQQVDRWNRYQDALDKVRHQCEIEGVRFRRRMKTSYSERRERNIKQLIAICLLTSAIYISVAGYGAWQESQKPVNIYTILQERPDVWERASEIVTGGFTMGIGMSAVAFQYLWNRGKLPEKIKFQCKPIINIDDLYYLQKFVKGMAKEKHDPKVVLPELTMELPQSWIKQQSLLSVMSNMKDIRF